MYTLRYAFTGTPGLTILANLINDQGATLQSATILESFELSGSYGITVQHQTQFMGYISFYNSANNDIIALFCVNPQEGENLDIPNSQVFQAELGAGGSLFEYTVVNYLNAPVDAVAVWITADIEGHQVVAGTIYSDPSGYVRFMLDAGTFYLWRHHRAWNFNNPIRITVN